MTLSAAAQQGCFDSVPVLETLVQDLPICRVTVQYQWFVLISGSTPMSDSWQCKVVWTCNEPASGGSSGGSVATGGSGSVGSQSGSAGSASTCVWDATYTWYKNTVEQVTATLRPTMVCPNCPGTDMYSTVTVPVPAAACGGGGSTVLIEIFGSCQSP